MKEDWGHIWEIFDHTINNDQENSNDIIYFFVHLKPKDIHDTYH